jgi:hypothetical protein
MQHCANIRGADPAYVDACKKIMEDLSTLNSRVGDFLQSEQVTMVRTGDMLTGRVDCPIAQYMDTLYDLWGSDTGHGDKLAYSKIAIGLLDSQEPAGDRPPPQPPIKKDVSGHFSRFTVQKRG